MASSIFGRFPFNNFTLISALTMPSNKDEPSNIHVNIENPENLDLRVTVTMRAKGKAPVTREYTSLPKPKRIDQRTPGSEEKAPSPSPVSSSFPAPSKKSFRNIGQIIVFWSGLLKNHSVRLGRMLAPYLNRSKTLPFFGLALLVYLLARLIGITRYPPFFSFDEASMTLIANEFLHNGLRSSSGEFLPALFNNIDKYNLGVSIYVQVLPTLLFGRSDAITRSVPALISIIAGLSVGLMLRDFFKVRFWWAGTLILSLLPAWFLFSRTAYETSLMVSFYAGALYCYLVYRYKNPKYLYPAILFSALAFYSHGSGQILVTLTAVLLVLSDLPYHWQNRRTVGYGLLLTLFVGLTYLRHHLNHAGDSQNFLRALTTYLFEDISVGQKILRFTQEYLGYLNPLYWFKPEYGETVHDSNPYMMKGYGYIPFYLAPFMAWGFWLTLKNLRQAAYRILLIAFLVTPVSASLVLSPSSITRLLMMVIPASLLIAIGLDDLLQRLSQRAAIKNPSFWALPVFLILTAINLYTLGDALLNGPKWFTNKVDAFAPTNAHVIFHKLKDEVKENPDQFIVISPIWAMMPDRLVRFYLGDSAPVGLASLYDLDFQKGNLENTLFVVTAEELAFAQANPKFDHIQIIENVPYPDGQPGISFIHLAYSLESDQIFAKEAAERRELDTAQILIDGQPVTIAYTQDAGTAIESLFDNNPESLYKSNSVNPVIFDITFDQPRSIHSIFIIHGSSPLHLSAQIFPVGEETAITAEADFEENGTEGNTLQLAQPVLVKRIIISVEDTTTDKNGIVHLWEISFE